MKKGNSENELDRLVRSVVERVESVIDPEEFEVEIAFGCFVSTVHDLTKPPAVPGRTASVILKRRRIFFHHGKPIEERIALRTVVGKTNLEALQILEEVTGTRP